MLLLEAPSLQDALSQESLERFEALQVILTNQKIPFTVNSRLVRGLDYYCHTAFEIKSEKLGAQSTICGGGRYDGLVKQLGGPEISSIGWAIGLERLMILLEDSFTFSSGVSDIYLINRGELAKKYALALLRKLRDADFSVEMDHTGSTFSKQFKRADRSGSMWAVILGDDEISEGSFKLRKLSQELASKEKDKLFPILQPENLIIFLKKSLEEID